jgi:hypothetical protein
MPRIVEERFYGGVGQKIARLGLMPLIDEVRSLLTGFTLLVEEKKDANGAAGIRKRIDRRFEQQGGWTKAASGSADWTKSKIVNGTTLCLEVEIQVSARSDLLIRDVIHLRDSLEAGRIDVGIIVVPSDTLGPFLTDRTPRLRDATRTIKEARAENLPILLIAVEHDGPGPALPKQRKSA